MGQTCQFGQRFTGVVFDAALLETPSPYKDDELHSALRRIAEQRILQVAYNLPISWRVRDYLVGQGGKPRIDMPDVARALGMSTRSLRRRLNHSTTFHRAFKRWTGTTPKEFRQQHC